MDSRCAECKSESLVQTIEDVVCTECGLVQRGSMSISEEPAHHADPMRCDEPVRYPSLFSVSHPEGPRHEPQRIRNRYGTSSTQKAFKKKTGSTIEERGKDAVQRLMLPDSLVSSVMALYEEATRDSMCKDARKLATMAACIHATCADRGVTRSYKEVSNASGVPKKDIIRESRILESRGLRAKVDGARTSTDIVVRCVGAMAKLDLKARRSVAALARTNIERCDQIHLHGKTPTTVAGVFIWDSVLALGYDRTLSVTLKDVESAVGVKKITIKDLMAKIREPK